MDLINQTYKNKQTNALPQPLMVTYLSFWGGAGGGGNEGVEGEVGMVQSSLDKELYCLFACWIFEMGAVDR